MKILIDSCLAGSVAAVLSEAGYEVECVADWAADPGDQAILVHALSRGQIVLTLDKDFGELAVVRRQSHAGIVRLVGFKAGEQASAAIAALSRYPQPLTDTLLTVEPGRTRVRPPEL